MSGMHALLVGINQYHPNTSINPLSGCENDVERFEKYLEQSFPDSHIKTLKGAEATRENVIDAFIHHLAGTQVLPGDIVLFYFSGHGSYAVSNPAFKTFDALGLDETLVLYDSRTEGGYDLADKEIALLLKKIPEGANIVCIIDSCHSGSISRGTVDRFTLGKAKHTPGKNKVRALSEYLHIDDTLNYEKMPVLEIPLTRHIVLSACDREEVAYESGQTPTGVFSDALLTALEANSEVSYSALFEYVHALLQYKKQTPQLRVYGGYNADLRFLGDKVQSGDPVYRVQRKNGLWVVNAGSFHGVKKGANVNIQHNTVITVPVVSVGLDVSELQELDLPVGLYKASISNIKPVINILVEGDWPYRYDKIAFFTAADLAYDYRLSLADERIALFRADGTLVHGVKTISKAAMAYMFECCKQLCQWHLLLQLENPDTKFAVDFTADVEVENVWKSLRGSSTLCMEDNVPLPLKINVESNSGTPYYTAVYTLGENYGIVRKTADVDASVLIKGATLPGLNGQKRYKIPTDREDLTLRFKLIVSKSPFKDFFIKTGSDLSREIVDLTVSRGVPTVTGEVNDSFDQDWYTETITVRLVRSAGKINAAESFGAGKISIDKHPALSAVANIGAVAASAKAVHPATALQEMLRLNGFEVINLNDSSKGDEPPADIIHLSAIENVAALNEQPLVVRLKDHDEAEVMAVTMEDGIIVPLGVATRNQPDEQIIEISALPEGNVEGTKNLLRAAWFCLVKIVAGKNASKLRRVVYEDGIKYKDDVSVNAGDRVLLLIHGIIGDTKGQAACVKFLSEQYDVILAYDYENLNTTIEEIAADLKDRLIVAGVSRLDIVAHSMGGLVSRYMIEHIPAAEGWVDKLYMFGTPNGGSELGKIPLWRNRVMGLLTLGCNVGRAVLGTLGPVLAAINKGLAATVPFTNTLAQMNENSGFYKLLNGPASNRVTAEYYVIAGDLYQYTPEDPVWFKRLVEKAEMQAGKWINKGIPNDIAVSVDSIQTVATVHKKVVGCHHLNYFEAPLSVEYFKSLQAVMVND